MGPNGSGEVPGPAIMGHPGYEITGGKIRLNDEDVLEMEADEQARAGIFLAFQRPMAIRSRWLTSFGSDDRIRRPDRKEARLIPMREYKELKDKIAHQEWTWNLPARGDGFSR